MCPKGKHSSFNQSNCNSSELKTLHEFSEEDSSQIIRMEVNMNYDIFNIPWIHVVLLGENCKILRKLCAALWRVDGKLKVAALRQTGCAFIRDYRLSGVSEGVPVEESPWNLWNHYSTIVLRGLSGCPQLVPNSSREMHVSRCQFFQLVAVIMLYLFLCSPFVLCHFFVTIRNIFLNLANLNLIRIVIDPIRLIWRQTIYCIVPNHSENAK